MNIPDFVNLEIQMATLMSQQEHSGFKFNMDAAVRIRKELERECESIKEKIRSVYHYYPGKVFTPKRTSTKTGYVAGAPMTKLLDFNPTSRNHIRWALETYRGARFTKVTDKDNPVVDAAVLKEIRDNSLSSGNQQLHDECEMFLRLLTLQKWMGQLSEGPKSWFNCIEDDNCIHHRCFLGTQTGRNAHKGPNLGQVNKAPWARELFGPFPGHVMVGADLEGIELRALGHYLSVFDEGAFAEVVLNGDIHQQNADRVGCSRSEVKNLTYAFIYGGGDAKLAHILHPEYSVAKKKTLGAELRRKFLQAIPGLEPLVNAVKIKVRETGKLKALDGRPIFCDAEHKSLNFLLQSCGAVIAKRWCVISQQLIDEAGYAYDHDYTRCAFIHDECQFSVIPQEAESFKQLLVQAAPLAGQYYNFRVPISAAGAIGEDWASTH